MNQIKKLSVLIIMMLVFSTSFADVYQVNVTRKGSNIYKILGKDALIQTRYCYEYAYGEEALLRADGGYGGELVFTSSGSKCDVSGLYAKTDQNAGTYVVTVSRVSDDWYEVMGSNVFIKTNMCLSLDLAAESILKLGPGGIGNIKINANDCMVDGVYSKMKL